MDNRTHILDCALRLFSARGYDAVGIQEVVDAAGVTKPTAYHYFTNKRGLLDTLLEREMAGLFVVLRPVAAYQGDLPLTLEKIVQAYFGFARENPAFYRMLLTLYFAPPDSEPNQAARKFGAEQQAMLEAVFTQAVKEHGNMRGRHRMYATTFLGMINTYIGMFLNEYVELNDALLRQAVHQFMHGIFS
jgi:AcrR family transcriptional regulator